MSFDQGAAERAAAAAQVIVEDLASLELTKDDAHHLFRVRRLRSGERVIATDGRGSWRSCLIDDDALVGKGDIVTEPAPENEVCVGFAPVKGDRSEWAVAKLTELGCDRIVALKTDRAAIRWNDNSAAKALERWERIAREACCQSRRVWMPRLEGPRSVADFVGREGVALAVPGSGPVHSSIRTILVGPEGGWSPEEMGLGFEEIGLAETVLRTETAALSAGVLFAGLREGTVGFMNASEGER